MRTKWNFTIVALPMQDSWRFNSQECAASRTLAEPKSTGPEGTLVEQYHPKPHVSGYFLLAVDPWEGLEAVHA